MSTRHVIGSLPRIAPDLLVCLLAGGLLSGGAAAVEMALPSAAVAMQVVACGPDASGQNNIFTGYETFGIQLEGECPGGIPLGFYQDGVNQVAVGAASGWQTTTPSGLEITSVNIPFGAMSVGSGAVGTGYLAQFYWNSGPPYRVVPATGLLSAPLPPGTSTFGWRLQCNPSGTTCPPIGPLNPSYPASMWVSDIQLGVDELSGYGPALANGSGLWSQPGWVRGQWPLGFTSSSVSGVCQESATLNGLGLPGTVDVSAQKNQTTWTQCAAPPYSTALNTASFGQGAMTLALNATDAADQSGVASETVYVDNSAPTVTLSGPTNAPTTAGTQYVTATGGGSIAPVIAIQCSVDGAPAVTYKGSTAQVPVGGVGEHVVSCTDQDAAVDAVGVHGSSVAPAPWHLDIGDPTVGVISFAKMVGGLSCSHVKERVKVAARWVTLRRQGRLLKVYRRAHTKVVKAIKCKPRIMKRKVTVLVKEKLHGRTVLVKRKKVERVAVPPHLVATAICRVRFGKGASVSGWLGTTSGIALGGRAVAILTAPNNGLGQWSEAGVVTTAANGTWSAQLPAGPSRLVEAAYAGDSTTEPSTSSTVDLVVPAQVRIKITPRRVKWGGKLQISGRVLGGYIPAGKLLRLRIGVEGVRETVGIPNVGRNGRFHTTWTFAPGRGVVRYWFSISTLNEADYPFAPASSRRVYVTVGPG